MNWKEELKSWETWNGDPPNTEDYEIFITELIEKLIEDIPEFIMESKTATSLPLEKLKQQLKAKWLKK